MYQSLIIKNENFKTLDDSFNLYENYFWFFYRNVILSFSIFIITNIEDDILRTCH